MNSLEHSAYHSVLRIAAATLALTLLFVSGAVSPVTQNLTLTTENYLANAVGASAGVAPTELNTITAALTEQQTTLDARAAELNERALALGMTDTDTSRSTWQAEYTTLINSLLLFIVLVLLVLNYVLDFAHRRERSRAQAVHNTVTS